MSTSTKPHVLLKLSQRMTTLASLEPFSHAVFIAFDAAGGLPVRHNHAVRHNAEVPVDDCIIKLDCHQQVVYCLSIS